MEKQINIARLLIGLRIIGVDQVEWKYETVDGRIQKVLSLKVGAAWENVYFTPQSLVFDETPGDNPSGILMDQQIRLKFPGDDRTDMSRFGNARHIVELEYDNGDKIVLGNTDNPFQSKYSFASKEQGYVINFYRKVAI